MSQDIIVIILSALALMGVYIHVRNAGLKSQQKQLQGQDQKLLTKQSGVEQEIIDIKKQLAEKKTGQQNMTPQQVEAYWASEDNKNGKKDR